jgi:hypothetical protein
MNYYLHPRRLVAFIVSLGPLMAGAAFLDIVDWTFSSVAVLGLGTYFLAPVSYRLLTPRNPDMILLSLALMFLVVVIVYETWCRVVGVEPFEMSYNLMLCGPIYYLAGFVFEEVGK